MVPFSSGNENGFCWNQLNKKTNNSITKAWVSALCFAYIVTFSLHNEAIITYILPHRTIKMLIQSRLPPGILIHSSWISTSPHSTFLTQHKNHVLNDLAIMMEDSALFRQAVSLVGRTLLISVPPWISCKPLVYEPLGTAW